MSTPPVGIVNQTNQPLYLIIRAALEDPRTVEFHLWKTPPLPLPTDTLHRLRIGAEAALTGHPYTHFQVVNRLGEAVSCQKMKDSDGRTVLVIEPAYAAKGEAGELTNSGK